MESGVSPFVNMMGQDVPFREGSSLSGLYPVLLHGREKECSSEKEESGGVSRLGFLPLVSETSRRGNLSDLWGNPF